VQLVGSHWSSKMKKASRRDLARMWRKSITTFQYECLPSMWTTSHAGSAVCGTTVSESPWNVWSLPGKRRCSRATALGLYPVSNRSKLCTCNSGFDASQMAVEWPTLKPGDAHAHGSRAPRTYLTHMSQNLLHPLSGYTRSVYVTNVLYSLG